MDTASLKPRFNAPHEPFRTPYIGEKTGRKEAYPSRLQRYVKHTTYNTFSYTEDVVFRNNPSFIYGLQINPSKPVSSVYKRQSLIFSLAFSLPQLQTPLDKGHTGGQQRVTISRSNELPQLSSTSYHNSFERVVVSLCNELW